MATPIPTFCEAEQTPTGCLSSAQTRQPASLHPGTPFTGPAGQRSHLGRTETHRQTKSGGVISTLHDIYSEEVKGHGAKNACANAKDTGFAREYTIQSPELGVNTQWPLSLADIFQNIVQDSLAFRNLVKLWDLKAARTCDVTQPNLPFYLQK